MPAFVSRAFRHTSIYVRTDRIKKPADLKGSKVGVPEYQLTANVWARAFLEDDYGVKPSDIHWIRGGIEDAGRPEKISVKLPPGVRLDNAPEGKTISALLEEGEIDGFMAPRPPSLLEKGHPHVGWLFPDPMAVAKDYFKRTGIFPIMHPVGIRRELPSNIPWLPGAVLKAFGQAKAGRPRKTLRHLGHQGDPALCRGAARRGARADGPRFLVLWRRAEPQGAGLLSSPTIMPQGLSSRRLRSTNCFIPPPTKRSSCNLLLFPAVRGEGRDEGAPTLPEHAFMVRCADA